MKPIIPLVLFIAISQIAFAQAPMKNKSQLKSDVQALFQSVSGDFAIAFKNLSEENDQLLINADESFHAASTMKTPVMIEIFKQAEAGKFSLDDSIVIKNEFKSIVDGSTYTMDIGRDSGEGLYEHIGQKRTIGELVYDMIIYSSNLATNIVIELVDAKKITATMRDLGADNIQVLRGVEDIKAYDQGLNNTTTAHDLMAVYEALAEGDFISKKANQRMIDILLDQKHNEIIPAKLPSDVKVAHKTGSITGVHHDSGIVFLPDGRKYVLVILSKNMEDDGKGTEMMAEVSEMVYKYIMKKGKY